jgi:hypothetical protein
MDSLGGVKDALLANGSAFCRYLFPNGVERGNCFAVGSLAGETGGSLKVTLGGRWAGAWRDFATGDGGGNLLELLRCARGYTIADARREAAEWLKMPHLRRCCCGTNLAAKPSAIADEKALKRHRFGDLQRSEVRDFIKPSRLLGVAVEALLLAGEDGVLRFADSKVNGRLWVVVDKLKRVRQDRRLNGFSFIFRNHTLAKARTTGSPTCPVGMPTNKPFVELVEGSSDLLAAYALAYVEGMESLIAPVAMLGAANHIHRSAIDCFHGKLVLAFPDYDSAGINGVNRWEKQLDGVAQSFHALDYGGLRRDDGQRIKDLRDFLRIAVDSWELDGGVRSPIGRFIGGTSGGNG